MSDIVLGENDPRDDIVAEADPNAPKVDPEVRKAHLAAAEGAVLRADDLIAGYIPGVSILNGADLYCQEGELVGIIGPNGAGKSTLLKALFGLVKIGTGKVTLRGDDVTNERADVLVSKGIGFVPQTNNVFPSLTIEENLQMGCYQAPSKFTERFKFVTDLFPALGDRRNQRAGSLSGGERQRLKLATSLAEGGPPSLTARGSRSSGGTSVYVLDEPTTGLHLADLEQLLGLLDRLVDSGKSVIVIEHHLSVVAHADWIIDLGPGAGHDGGRVVFEGTPSDLVEARSTLTAEYLAAFVSSMAKRLVSR